MFDTTKVRIFLSVWSISVRILKFIRSMRHKDPYILYTNQKDPYILRPMRCEDPYIPWANQVARILMTVKPPLRREEPCIFYANQREDSYFLWISHT